MNKDLIALVGLGAIAAAMMVPESPEPEYKPDRIPPEVTQQEVITPKEVPAVIDYDEIIPLTKEQFQEVKKKIAEEILRQEAELQLKKDAERRTAAEAEAKSWLTDYNRARELGRELRRPVLVAFSRTLCKDCQLIDKYIYQEDASWDRITKEYVPLLAHSDPKDPGSFWLAKQLGVTLWPKVALIYPDGSVKWVMTPSSKPTQYFTDLEKLR